MLTKVLEALELARVELIEARKGLDGSEDSPDCELVLYLEEAADFCCKASDAVEQAIGCR